MIAWNNASARQLLNFLVTSPAYINDVFKPAGHPNTNTKASFLTLIQPL